MIFHTCVGQADIALYKAKEDGRNRLRFFDPSLQADVTERLALIRDLRIATERCELSLYYQPVVNASGSILGVEALLRWQHPERGFVPPMQFISLAEQSSLILPIGKWALQTACEQLSRWAVDPVRCTWSIAVNVSARQLYEPGFVTQVQQIVDQTGANPQRLRLELTESMLQNDLDEAITKMASSGTLPAFLPVNFPATQPTPKSAGQYIEVEVHKGNTTVKVKWPLQASHSCLIWLREIAQ